MTLCFQFVSDAVSASASVTDAVKTFASHVKTVWANLRYLGQRNYRSGKMYWMTFWWPWPKVMAVTSIKICLSAGLSKNHSTSHYKTWLLYPPGHVYHLFRFWWNSVINSFFAKFSLKISDVLFQGQTLYWTYLRIGWSDWCETKRRCIGWYWVKLCYLDLWPHPWPWPLIFQGQISK